jgi:anti-sigma regulatory factor (Ser/Thr protein kinase)
VNVGYVDMVTPEQDNEIVLKIPCRPEYVRTVRLAVAEFAHALKMPNPVIEEIEIAASEAVANVIRHAYEGHPRNAQVRIKCSQGKTGMVVEIVDKGCGFDAPACNVIPEADPDREGGLGIILIKSFMDRVRYTSKPGSGTRLRMMRRTPSDTPGRPKNGPLCLL